MDLHDLTSVLAAEGPFVTVLVDSESDVEQAADTDELQWRNVLRELEDKGVNARTRDAVAAARGAHTGGAARLVVASVPDATVRLAVSLSTPPRRPVVDVAALPHLLPLVDVLLRAAIGTGAGVQLVPGEMDSSPQMGLGATLRYADGPGALAGSPA